ncbi:hypothetical protein [Paenibacillus thalictri]|uniref:Uncharacterized protein n=1 Tax=Paenibacillus thalictri TaxID=2527873 RepID=A0A4Q9DW60_9BACL|nr:hypothetical protein [Paenibacillus thalictri]TBL81269.1 hypothetical protein EYB31_04050 [Paenibacillus thalictri]
MKIRFQTTLNVNLKKIVGDCVVNVPETELHSEIKHIVGFWAEQRLYDEKWPLPNDFRAIREHLIENEIISVIDEHEDFLSI